MFVGNNTRIITKYIALLLGTIALVCFWSIGKEVVVYGADANEIFLDDNSRDEDIVDAWGKIIRSNLVKTEDGYLSVNAYHAEDEDGFVSIQMYNNDYKFVRQLILPMELPLYGGFYAGTDAYYIVQGQTNDENSDDCEVFRVIKYDKNFERIGSASLYGENTKIPFKAGSLRMAESQEDLYIRTCHLMYSGHQANVTIQIDKADMTVIAAMTDVSNVSMGYVSHSFNQFIDVDDDGTIVALDHGDAYPRGSVLFTYRNSDLQRDTNEMWLEEVGSEVISAEKISAEEINTDEIQIEEMDAGSSFLRRDIKNVLLQEYYGEIGDNVTCAGVGGLACSKDYYLTVGCSVVQNETARQQTCHNIYLTTTSKDNFTEEGTTFTYLTQYDNYGNIEVGMPKLVAINEDRFLIMWPKIAYSGELHDYSFEVTENNIQYCFINGSGTLVSDIYDTRGYMSECQPIVVGDRVMWVYQQDRKLVFASIYSDGSYEEKEAVFDSNISIYPISLYECKVLALKVGDVKESQIMKSFAVVSQDGEILNNSYLDWEIEEENYSKHKLVKGAVLVQGDGHHYIGAKYSRIEPVKKVDIATIDYSNGSVVLSTMDNNAYGVNIYRKKDNGKYKKVATVDAFSSGNAWTDKSVKDKHIYSYYVKPYVKQNGKKVYGKQSKIVNMNLKNKKVSNLKGKHKKKTIELSFDGPSDFYEYEIQVAQKKNFQDAMGIIYTSSSYGRKTVRVNLYREGKHYVRVRGIKRGQKEVTYTGWTKVKKY